MESYVAYGAIAIAVIGFCIQFGMFVRPVELERKHREIIEDSYKKFASIDTVESIKDELTDMKCKIDKIYEMLMKRESK